MPRAANPFVFQDPTQAIGTSLAEALFGNPQKALEQQRIQAELDARAAQAERDRAAAAYDTQRTRGAGIQNDASTSLPDLLAKLYRAPVSVPSVNDPAFLDGVGTAPPVPTDTEQFAANLAPVVATLAQIQGDKVDTPETIGTLASFFGGDELARRGLIAQGHTPTADFAINSQRADEIAANDAAAKLRQALGVAEINNRDDVPVAKIQAGASNYRADRSLEGTKYGADASAAASRYSAEQRAEAKRVAAERRAAEREETRGAAPISASAYTKLAKAVERQLDEQGLQSLPSKSGKLDFSRLDPGVHTWIRSRAIENFRQSGNFDDAAARAIRAAVVDSKRQKAARAQVEVLKQSSPTKGVPGRQYSVAEAARLPKGTRFIGIDGVERVRQ